MDNLYTKSQAIQLIAALEKKTGLKHKKVYDCDEDLYMVECVGTPVNPIPLKPMKYQPKKIKEYALQYVRETPESVIGIGPDGQERWYKKFFYQYRIVEGQLIVPLGTTKARRQGLIA